MYIYTQGDLNIANDALIQDLLTGSIETPGVNWMGAKSFKVKGIKTSGYQPHTRNKGFNPGTIQQTEDIYTLEFDRDIEFYVDSMDVDETNQQLTAANITRAFIREQATPEIDAYRLSKLAQYSITDSAASTTALTSANIIATIQGLVAPIRKYGMGNISVFMHSNAFNLLNGAPDFHKHYDVKDAGTAVETRITSIDGVQLQEIWAADRLFTKYDFTDGFRPTDDAQVIQIMAIVRPAVVAKVKHSFISLKSQAEHSQGDGWLYQNRLYHDLWRLNNYAGAVRTVLSAQA